MYNQKVVLRSLVLIMAVILMFTSVSSIPVKAEKLSNEKIYNPGFENVIQDPAKWTYDGGPDGWGKYVNSTIASYVQFGCVSQNVYEGGKCMKINITNYCWQREERHTIWCLHLS